MKMKIKHQEKLIKIKYKIQKYKICKLFQIMGIWTMSVEEVLKTETGKTFSNISSFA